MALDDYITTAEACELLGGLDRSTLSRWVQLGKLTPAKRLPFGHGAFLFHRADIERLRDELAQAAS
jgi:excisionase family DNA binding protein